MSISISPAITTTPAIDSLFPIYYDDLTEEQKQSGVNIHLTTTTPFSAEDVFTFTIEPTPDWYAVGDDFGEKGQAVTKEVVTGDNELIISNGMVATNRDESNPQFITINIEVEYNG